MRETITNSLGVEVTRPNQELIILRGVSGAGKSTLAKKLVKEGVIHSTDSVIEKTGDYKKFFEDCKNPNSGVSLYKAHMTNLNEAVNSMKNGITPVIIDNTNIKISAPKAYVVEALKMGFADDNIKFVDIGTNGFSLDELVLRNTHGVTREILDSMINSHRGQGEMTLKRVLEAKDLMEYSDVLYSAVVLDEDSKSKLITKFGSYIPNDWKVFANHMTIVFGKGLEDKSELGKEIELKVTKFGYSNMAMAVQVEGYPSTKQTPHITLAINPNGGAPKMSNDITDWAEVEPFFVKGIVTEIKRK